jgi:hypothetical protein
MKKLLFLLPSFLISSPFHYQNLNQGDKATFLGGAYTAISTDSSGMYNNPAGFIYSKDSISASVQAYNYSDISFDSDNPDIGSSYSKTSQGVMPSMVSYTFPELFLNGKVGFSFLTEDSLDISQYNNFQKNSTDEHTEISMQETYSILNGGLTYSTMLNDSISFGTTLYGVLRNHKYINKQFVDWEVHNGNELYAINYTDSLYAEDKQYGIKPIIGILYRDSTNSFGLSVSKEIIVYRDYKASYSSFDFDSSMYSSIESDEIPETPVSISLGYAYRDTSKIFSFDIDYHTPTTEKTIGHYKHTENNISQGVVTPSITEEDDEIPTFDAVRKGTVNVSLGFSLIFDKHSSLNMGLFTNFSNIDEDRLSDKYADGEDIDMYGGTISYSFPLQEKQDATIGILYSRGDGVANVGNLKLQDEAQADAVQQNFKVFLNITAF